MVAGELGLLESRVLAVVKDFLSASRAPTMAEAFLLASPVPSASMDPSAFQVPSLGFSGSFGLGGGGSMFSMFLMEPQPLQQRLSLIFLELQHTTVMIMMLCFTWCRISLVHKN